ncbi:methionine--tRNA ligase subunit beta [Candidatus Pacearchaeota archaeon]|nr:methionine--tRNA ligase subunit beta [Candidatus Pacearchaeota archaeon]
MENIINFEDWEKLDLRVGKILEVENIKGADKLFKLFVDIGSEKRTVCAGLKAYYSKEELVGKKIILFVNLAPRKLRGIESQGMVLASVSNDESKVKLIKPDKDVEVGSKIK